MKCAKEKEAKISNSKRILEQGFYVLVEMFRFFLMVEVAVEFFLTHCIAVTWVEHACKNSQLHMLLSCRKAGCRIN